MTDILSQLPASAFKKERSDKFTAKLDFSQRCAILALVRSNIQRNVVAAAFSVDRRTVGHICNDSGPHYKEVRRRFNEMGLEAFRETYLREDIVEAVAKAATTAEAKASNAGYAESKEGVSARANRKAGLHTIKPEQCAYSHRIEISYVNDGWHYRDLDSSAPNEWLHNGDASRRTSQACYEAAMENIVDEMKAD